MVYIKLKRIVPMEEEKGCLFHKQVNIKSLRHDGIHRPDGFIMLPNTLME